MYYSKPIYGRAYKPFTKELVDVSKEYAATFNFKKLIRYNNKEFALFTNGKSEIMQSLRAIRFVRCKPGEDNYNAKLTNAQGIEIFNRATKGEALEVLANEFGVTKDYVRDIKNMRARTSITLNYLNGKKKPDKVTTIVAKNNKGKKLSPSMAKFIRHDKEVNRLSTKELANKYCVTQRTIQKILKGDMYCDNIPIVNKQCLNQ